MKTLLSLSQQQNKAYCNLMASHECIPNRLGELKAAIQKIVQECSCAQGSHKAFGDLWNRLTFHSEPTDRAQTKGFLPIPLLTHISYKAPVSNQQAQMNRNRTQTKSNPTTPPSKKKKQTFTYT